MDIFMCSTQATRNLWWSKLTEESQEEIRKEPPTTNVQVFYQDLTNGIEYVSSYKYCNVMCVYNCATKMYYPKERKKSKNCPLPLQRTQCEC